MKRAVETENAPLAIGPYSQAVQAGGLLFVSGQISIDPATGKVIAGTVGEQTAIILENMKAILAAAGLGLDSVVKTTVYLRDLSSFEDINKVYGRYFNMPYPARATIEVSYLPKGVAVEIDAIATT